MTTPNRDIPYVPENTLDPAAGLNDSLDVIDAIIVPKVIRMDLTAPPGGEADGDLYIPAAPATGAWAGLENYLVRYRSEGAFWQAYPPAQVYLLLNADDLGLYKFDDSASPGSWTLAAGLADAPADGTKYARRDNAWVAAGIAIQDENSPPTVAVDPLELLIIGNGLELTELAPGVARLEGTGGGGDSPGAPGAVVMQMSASDLTTDLTAGTDRAYARAPRAFMLTDVRASLLTASGTGAVEVDILKNGVSILSTPLTIDQGELTSTTAATPAVIDDDAIGDDDEIAVNIDDAGDGARGLIVTLIGQP